MRPDWEEGLPTLQITAVEDDLSDIILRAQALVLTHPVAAQAAWSALVAEGRRAAQSPEGAALRRKLATAPILPRLRELLELGTLNALEADPTGPLPSDFLELLFSVMAEGRPLLDRLAQR